MSYSDPTKLFTVLKERAQTQSDGGSLGSFGNSNILKLKREKVYSLRLLWLPSDEREYPMINQYVHRIWDENAVGSKDVHVICPTSQYDQDNNGFKTCPICDRMSKLYKEAQEGSASADELYRKFKRTLRGYVPVYVVNGPAEDLHKVKILQYTISFKRYFDEKIFGIQSVKKNDDDSEKTESFDEAECVGINAFMYFDPKNNEVVTNGYNFIITVGTKKVPINGRMVEMPDYKLDFSRKETDITDFDGVKITPKYFTSLSKELHFDEDFYKMSSQDALNNFKMKYIDGVDDEFKPAAVNVKTEAVDNDITDIVEPEEEPVKEVKKPAPKKAEKKVEEEPVPEETNDEDSSGDDIDIDALLKEIN